MPQLADFHADLEGDRVTLPAAVAARLAGAGVVRVRVRIETPAAEPELLASRGIDEQTIAAVAGVQKIGLDVAAAVLAGEGIAPAGALFERLEGLRDGSTGEAPGGRNPH
jgi:hypothetical protein